MRAPSTDTVLVTGATGFVAKHCIAALLRAGYAVRGTVRDLARAEAVRAAVHDAGGEPARLSFAVGALDDDAGWAEAVAGCGGVLHVASPFPVAEPKRPEDVVRPAREGTLRVLRAARDAGVRRVVLTSSVLAVTLPLRDEPGHIYDERDWTDPERSGLTAYMASKAIAERAAWDFVRREGKGLELVAVNPALVLGPVLDADLSASLEVLRLMARGSYPMVPRARLNVCDVRDVAEVHVRALSEPAAAGERFLVSGGTIALLELGGCSPRSADLLAARRAGSCRTGRCAPRPPRRAPSRGAARPGRAAPVLGGQGRARLRDAVPRPRRGDARRGGEHAPAGGDLSVVRSGPAGRARQLQPEVRAARHRAQPAGD
ncbi:MAG: aldehyde reductase [Polyangiaceae bacterium]